MSATDMTADRLIRLGERIAEHGFGNEELGVAEVVAAARRRKLPLAAVGVLADPSAPAAPRARALALVSAALVRASGRPATEIEALVA